MIVILDLQCNNCRARKFIRDEERAELICEGCGKVASAQVPENNSTDVESLGSVVGPSSQRNSSNRDVVDSLKRVQNFVVPDWDGVRWKKLIDDLSDKLGAPSYVRDSAMYFLRENPESIRRMNRLEAATALLYTFSKSYVKGHMSLRDICKTLGADEVTTKRYLKRFAFDYELKPPYIPPEDYVRIHAARMSLDDEIIERSLEIVHHYRETTASAEMPQTIGASALYLACRQNGVRHTQSELASIFGVAEYTVREVSIKIRHLLGLDR